MRAWLKLKQDKTLLLGWGILPGIQGACSSRQRISEQPSCDWRNIKKKKIRIGKCEKVKQIWKMEGKGGYENEHSQKEGVRFRSGTPSSRARGRWSLWYDVMCVLVKWEGKLNLHFMLLNPWLLAVNTLSYNRKRYRFSVLGFHHCQRIIIIMDPCFFYLPPLFMFFFFS